LSEASESKRDRANVQLADDAPVTWRSHFTLFVLFMLMAVDYVDRQVLSALLPYMKDDWRLSDTELGGIVAAVNIALALFAFPAAVWADKWSRTKSIGVMAIFWSFATIGCTFASTFIQLVVARFLIGAGEAGFTSAGNSLVAAAYPKRLRATVIGLFQSATMLGSVVGVVLGGYIASRFGWRNAFGIVALPGLVFAVLAFFIRDYPNESALDTGESSKAGWMEFVRVIFGKPVLLLIFFACAVQLLFVATIGNWLPSYFTRAYGMSVPAAGAQTGLLILISGFGMVAGGVLTDRVFGASSGRRLLGPAAFALLSGLIFTLAFWLPAGAMQKSLFLLGAFVMVGIMGPVIAVIQDLAPLHMRTSVTGAMVLCNNLFGMAIGPVAAGALSDRFDLQTSLLIISLTPFVAAIIYALSIAPYERGRVTARKATAQ
jgi:MFS transporter, Spinster family, sphingosine-1-phosphate transporter